MQVEVAAPDLGQLAVDLDGVDLGRREVVAVGARDGAGGVAEDRDALRARACRLANGVTSSPSQ